MGSLFYMMQLYLDFSAYYDMAIGLGEIIGMEYRENFNYPYIATSVRDFWRRWHISLSSFFRDYVYIPLGGSRVGFGRLMLNLLAVWVLTGLWHGASWNFILWGLYYFVFIVIENLYMKYTGEKVKNLSHGVIMRVLGHLYTLVVVFFGWVLFRITDFHKLWEVLNVLLGRSGRVLYTASEVLTLRGNAYFVIFAVSFCVPLWKNIALAVRERLHSSQHKEAQEMQNLEDEHQLHEQEEKDHELVEKFGSESLGILDEVKKQDIESHERMVTRLENRIKKRKNERVIREAIFYGMRTILMLVFLFVSILAMVGATYSPFLYNQF
jgi:alginate O-acetyltransferase complex protein AlgI